ncbi:MAG: hypothetical protein JO246_14945 [Frankiaceae bacterium]|nr:hypothetical protein [Frankiaceae bacterium]
MTRTSAAARDAIDQAIGAAEAPVEIAMAEMQFTLPTGRPMALMLPADATDFEILSAVAVVLHAGDQLRAQRNAQAQKPHLVRAPAMPGLRQ